MEMGSFIQQIMQSLGYRNNISHLLQALSQQAASFIDLCECRAPRMRAVIDELQQISANVKRRQQESLSFILLGLSVFGFGVKAISHGGEFIPVLNIAVGTLLILTGIILAGTFLKNLITVEFENAPKMNKLMKEFGMIVADLRNCLEAVKSVCGHLRVGSVGSQALTFIQLEIKTLELFTITVNLRTLTTLPCNTQTSDEYKKVADEFVKMKSDLKAFCIQQSAQN